MHFINRSFDVEQKMTEGVENTDCCYCASHDRQQLPHQLIQLRLVLLINNIDWLDFCHKHKTWEIFLDVTEAGSQRITIVLATRL